MGQKRRTVTREFKLEAVRLLKESGKPRREIARDLGIGINTLDRWKSEVAADSSQAFRGNGKRTAESERIWRLEQEIETLKREREI